MTALSATAPGAGHGLARIITDLLGSTHASLDLLRSVPAAAGAPAEHGGCAGAEATGPAATGP